MTWTQALQWNNSSSDGWNSYWVASKQAAHTAWRHGDMDTLDKVMTRPRWSREDGERCHHAAQNDAQFKTCELFIAGIFHLIFSDCGWPHVTETKESKTVDGGRGGDHYTVNCSRSKLRPYWFSHSTNTYWIPTGCPDLFQMLGIQHQRQRKLLSSGSLYFRGRGGWQITKYHDFK